MEAIGGHPVSSSSDSNGNSAENHQGNGCVLEKWNHNAMEASLEAGWLASAAGYSGGQRVEGGCCKPHTTIVQDAV